MLFAVNRRLVSGTAVPYDRCLSASHTATHCPPWTKEMVLRYASAMARRGSREAMGDFMTAAEVAALLGVSPGRVRQLTIEGKLTAAPPIAGRRFYRRNDVKRFARERAAQARLPRQRRKT